MAKFHSLTIKDIRRETADAVSIAFDVPETLQSEFEFKQGQYLTLKAEINGEEVRRNYSVCVSPLEGELRIAVKKVPDGRFSTFANERLNVGDTLDVMTPMGKFFTEMNPDNEKTYVGFAGGSGITPVMSILKTVLQVEPNSDFVLFYANRGFDSIIFREEIEALKNQFMERLTVYHVFSEEVLDSELFNGFITAEKCKTFAKYLFDVAQVDEYFICGPEPMMLAIQEGLTDLGVEKKKIHMELFTSMTSKMYTKTAPPKKDFDPTKESRITITVDGSSFDIELGYGGKSILDAAQQSGADVPFACKGGVCATCKAKVLEGEVDMEVNYALEEDEVKDGYILTCQSHPRSERVVVDFDF